VIYTFFGTSVKPFHIQTDINQLHPVMGLLQRCILLNEAETVFNDKEKNDSLKSTRIEKFQVSASHIREHVSF
jgi:hypothetical protein